jgi:hypothetical protein
MTTSDLRFSVYHKRYSNYVGHDADALRQLIPFGAAQATLSDAAAVETPDSIQLAHLAQRRMDVSWVDVREKWGEGENEGTLAIS